MREREGAHLAKDLAARVGVMRKCVERVGKQAPKSAERYRQQLIERIKTAGLPAPAVDDERLLKEVVFFADRSDISEELTRLQSHFKQFEDCARSQRAGRAHAGFSRPGNEPRDQHHRLEGERRVDLARSRDIEGGTGKVPRTGDERGIETLNL